MRPGLDEVRDKQFGVFTSWQALCEYTRGEMRTRIDRGEWVRVLRGVYREAGTPSSPRLRVEAARLLLGLPSVTAAYSTAAELHGFSVWEDEATHVLGARASRSTRLVVHHDRIEPAELELVQGVVTTSAVRTAIDVARTVDRPAALATLETALRQGVSRAELRTEVARHERRLGWGQAVELLELAGHTPPSRECVRRIDLRSFPGRPLYPPIQRANSRSQTRASSGRA
ncbi:hypothetical protein [Nocardia goodfellowii]|uniref:Transcriptional regulator of viral defense system n=1 Tax=Nocardia goodfellowii TaxID=882446 RepID=A0ABS4Q6N3_9NOCA|nr:hypothetical protein [Nocardia goodfellowii]MBP2187341.1 putative transcriptional regulator of viral defense system [Nocardia goodfellowii]